VISFELSEEQQIARATIREFAQNVLRPVARKADTDAKIEASTLDSI